MYETINLKKNKNNKKEQPTLNTLHGKLKNHEKDHNLKMVIGYRRVAQHKH